MEIKLSKTRYIILNGFLRTGPVKKRERVGPHHGPLRPGFHVLVRWGDQWNHGKITLIRQQGLRITAKDKVTSVPRMYVTGYRLQLSVWRNRKGMQGQAAKWGFMIYGTKPSKVKTILRKRR